MKDPFLAGGISARQPSLEGANLLGYHPLLAKRSRFRVKLSDLHSHCASCTQRNPKAPERSLLGAINKSLPCSVNLYAWGKYQIDPCGW
jgi:hypothetical protein